MTYQGWTNEQTWCVAAYIDNDRELLPKAINYGKHNLGNRPAAKQGLNDLVLLNWFGVFKFAPWAWEQKTINDVNWDELLTHYYTKWKESLIYDNDKQL